jgi:hypothetical protein
MLCAAAERVDFMMHGHVLRTFVIKTSVRSRCLEDSKIRAAFTTMMNKLIFARRQVLEPYIRNLESLDTETSG